MPADVQTPAGLRSWHGLRTSGGRCTSGGPLMSPRRSPEATEELRAALIGHAQRLIAREGAQALTMRALAAEAGCAVGLPYKVFANREELVAELVLIELRQMRTAFDDFVASAGTGTIGGNLATYARTMLERDRRPALMLTWEVDDTALSKAVDAKVDESGFLAALEHAVTDYLAAEQRLGRIAPDVDVLAFGFVITGAIHNLVVSPDAYPRPSMHDLERVLDAVAARIASDRMATGPATARGAR